MADKSVRERAFDRLTMDHPPPILASPTTGKVVKGPKGMPSPFTSDRPDKPPVVDEEPE